MDSDMEKVKKFPLAEFLGFLISAKMCVILNMSKAMEKCENCSIFSELHIRNQKWQNPCANKAPVGTNNVFD